MCISEAVLLARRCAKPQSVLKFSGLDAFFKSVRKSRLFFHFSTAVRASYDNITFTSGDAHRARARGTFKVFIFFSVFNTDGKLSEIILNGVPQFKEVIIFALSCGDITREHSEQKECEQNYINYRHHK